MDWTSEYPTKPGFYWIRNYEIGGLTETISRSERTIAYVIQVRDGLSFWLFQWPDIFSKSRIISAEWQGPIEPESNKPILPAFYRSMEIACRDCKLTGRSFISWNLGEVDGKPLFGIICRDCWIKRLTPEQRKIYMV